MDEVISNLDNAEDFGDLYLFIDNDAGLSNRMGEIGLIGNGFMTDIQKMNIVTPGNVVRFRELDWAFTYTTGASNA